MKAYLKAHQLTPWNGYKNHHPKDYKKYNKNIFLLHGPKSGGSLPRKLPTLQIAGLPLVVNQKMISII